MALQPHVNSEVVVMLVIVGDVVRQHGAPDGFGGPCATNIRDLHRLNEVSVGGRCVHPVAIDESESFNFSLRRLPVSGCLAEFIERIQSRRAIGRPTRRMRHPAISARGPQCTQQVQAARVTRPRRSAPRLLPPARLAE